MKTIFCPVDFSPVSELAAEWGAMLSIKKQWNLVLFHKFKLFSPENEALKDPLANSREIAEARLLILKNSLIQKFSVENLNCTLDSDFGIDVEDVIIRSAEKSHADLIVMGTQGAESINDIIGGSNTTNMLSQTNLPLLVIPPSAKVFVPETLVYATDLKNENQENLKFIFYLAGSLNAKVSFIHITKKEQQSELNNLRNIIYDLLGGQKGIEYMDILDFYEIAGNDYYTSLQDFMKTKHNSILVLGQHPKNFFMKLLKGDLTRLMALYTEHPLLVLHKKD